MFATFNVSPINSSATESEIKKWKQSSAKKCYAKLFNKIKPHSTETYMSKIIGKIWKDKRNALKNQVAYAISVCEVILSPNNLIIQISEETTKHLLTKNYVSFLKFA
jgi:hypothetical protein